jgi:hypothetical protein
MKNRKLAIVGSMMFSALFFLSLVSSHASPCALFSEQFTGKASNQWLYNNADWMVKNDKLNVTNIETGKLASASAHIAPTGYFTIDVDVEPVFLTSSNGAYGLYFYTTGNKLITIDDIQTDGVAVFVFSNNVVLLAAWDDMDDSWYNIDYKVLNTTIASIGFSLAKEGVTLRLNKQDTTMRVATSIDQPAIFDRIALLAQGSASTPFGIGGSNVNFDNVCVDLIQAPAQNTLTVSKTGDGSGAITSSPAGINCGSDCTEKFNRGATVALTATAEAGSTFDGWNGGGCSGTGVCNVTLNLDVTVTAKFTKTKTQVCTASFNEDLILRIPIMSFMNDLFGKLFLWVDMQYVFTPKDVVFKLADFGAVNNPSAFQCAASTLNPDLSVNIPELTIVGSSQKYWLDLSYDADRSSGEDVYFLLKKFGVVGSDTKTVTLLSPQNGAEKQSLTPTLTWKASNGVTGFNLFVAKSDTELEDLKNNGTGCSDCIVSENVGTATSYVVPKDKLLPSNKYFWVVKATFGQDVVWSNIWNFMTGDSGGSTVTLLSPPDKSENQPLTPELKWSASSGAAGFSLFVAKTVTELLDLVNKGTACNECIVSESVGTATSYKLPNDKLQPSNRYFWVVKAMFGQEAEWSDVWGFVTAATGGGG